jgi:hypothetical protein
MPAGVGTPTHICPATARPPAPTTLEPPAPVDRAPRNFTFPTAFAALAAVPAIG